MTTQTTWSESPAVADPAGLPRLQGPGTDLCRHRGWNRCWQLLCCGGPWRLGVGAIPGEEGSRIGAHSREAPHRRGARQALGGPTRREVTIIFPLSLSPEVFSLKSRWRRSELQSAVEGHTSCGLHQFFPVKLSLSTFTVTVTITTTNTLAQTSTRTISTTHIGFHFGWFSYVRRVWC
jgi:hypothetical protein